MLETVQAVARELLAAILRPQAMQDALLRTDETARGGRADSFVEGHQVCRLCSAARVSGKADTLRVDLRSAQQIIETANVVPELIGSRIPSH